jgi:O-antigen ligase
MFSFALGGAFLTLLYNLGVGIEIEGGRISIFGDNENIIGIRLSLAITLFIYIVLSDLFSWRIWRFLLLIPIPYMLLFMFVTGSRVAFLAFVLAFLLGTLLYKTKKRWYKIVVLLFSVGIAMYVFQIMLQSEVLINRLLLTREQGDLAGRDIIWQSLLPLIKETFLWGVGQTGYSAFTAQTFGVEKSPHNVLIEVTAYTGIIGLFIYLYFLFNITKQAWKAYKIKGILVPLLFMIPVYGVILTGQALNVKIVWAIFAYIVSTIFYTKKINIQQNENPLRN